MPEAVRTNARINYEVWGDRGPWVTLVNGHTRPLNDFRMLGKSLVEQGFRVLALDNRGAGKSTVSGPFSIEDMAADVVALWDLEGVDLTYLAGISMGGFICQLLARQNRQRIARMALISTATGPAKIRRDDSTWTADLKQVREKLLPYFTAEFAARNEMLVTSMVKQIAKSVEQGAFAGQSELQKAAVRAFDSTPWIQSLDCPTLVIHGEADQITPLECGNELHEAIRGSQIEILEGAGHLLLAEKPRELYAALAAWFRES